MAAEVQHANELVKVVALLGAGVVAVPIFRRLGLGSVLAYLAAGLAIGPFGLGLFTDPQAILHIAELGVVMFLFVIGLEMQPSRLCNLRREIFGLGAAQVLTCGGLLTIVGLGFGLTPLVAFFAAMGFTLSSTAIAMQILEERHEVSSPQGQRVVSILLLEDLAIVPLLALVVLLAPGAGASSAGGYWQSAGIAIGTLGLLIAAGVWLLNPFFRILAASNAREVMTAAALLVVLGAALLMQLGGLSMALGAFLAGVLLSESVFRHELEADIEPFRGILLGLFFMGVGMSLDLTLMAKQWPLILLGTGAYMAAKMIGIYSIARLFRVNHNEGIYRAALMAQGGEFAFVLYSAATQAGIFQTSVNALLTAAVIVSMALTPLLMISLRWILPKEKVSMDGIDVADDLSGRVLIIGFGRFGQVTSQCLLAQGTDITIIDNDVEMIQAAADFGFKIYYGDGTRLDVLRAAGAERADVVCICIDKPEQTTKIVELMKADFLNTKVFARSFDRRHTLELLDKNVDFQIREIFESALSFGRATLEELGVDGMTAQEVVEDIRRRDLERLELQRTGSLSDGLEKMHQQRAKVQPAPLQKPSRQSAALNPEAAEAIKKEGPPAAN